MIPASEIKAGLAADAGNFAISQLGQPTWRSRSELRWGTKGSMALTIAGPKRGIWCDHESGQGGDLIDLICHVRGCDLKTAIGIGAAWLGMSDGERARIAPVMPAQKSGSATDDDDLKRRLRFASLIWDEAIDPAGSLVEVYLRSRDLKLPEYLEDCRFHPRCPRGAQERLPAMIWRMRNPLKGFPTGGLHRTFLQSDGRGKIDHGTQKAMLGPAGVIHTSDPCEVVHRIGITEGVETALALIQHGGWEPIWAAGSAGGIAKYPVLAYSDLHVTIFPDHDDNGVSLRAARECAQRWAATGREAFIEAPPGGKDWADIVRGVAA